jgi:hypothetical protein
MVILIVLRILRFFPTPPEYPAVRRHRVPASRILGPALREVEQEN